MRRSGDSMNNLYSHLPVRKHLSPTRKVHAVRVINPFLSCMGVIWRSTVLGPAILYRSPGALVLFLHLYYNNPAS